MKNFTKTHNLLLLIILFFFQLGYSQDLEIDLTLMTVGDDRFSVCGGERPVTVRLQNNSGETLTDASFILDLTNVEGIEFTGTISAITGAVPVHNPANSTALQEYFDLPDLAEDQVVEFVIGLEAGCGAIALTGSGGTPNFDINLTYTGGLGMQSENSGNFEVVKPALTVVSVMGNPVPPPLVKTGASASVFDAYLGQTDTLTTQIVNGGNGSLDQYVYYVIDHPLLDIETVLIGNYELPFIGSSNDTMFYAVDAAAIAQAVPDATSPPNDNTLFQFNEIMTFKEVWSVVDCAADFPDLERGAAFGCDASPYDLCEGNSLTSGLRFGFLRPNLRSSTAWGQITTEERLEGLRACYNDEIEIQRYWIYNEGGAPARNVKFSLSTYHPTQTPKTLLANNTKVSIGKFGTQTTLTPVRTYEANQVYGSCNIANQTVSADYDLSDIDLRIPPGDTLWIEFEADYTQCGCDNGTSTCNMRLYYFNVLNWGDGNWAADATYDDICELNTYDLSQVNSTNWNSRLSSIFETPASISDEQEQTASFTVSDGINNWLSDYLGSGRTRYPDGIYRMRFTIGEGLDWNGSDGDLGTSELTWLLKNGDTWPPSRIDYIDNEGGDDEIYVEFSFADYPAGLSYADGFGQGMKISFDVIGDCDETGPVCAQGNVATISSELYFSPDSNCTDCGEGDFVDCMQDTDIDVNCPSCEPCDGIVPISLQLLRKNYECSDNDADGRPDAVNNIDLSKVAQQRLISGDTLRVVYTARISASATKPDFLGAFSLLQLPTTENLSFLPQGGSLTIKKDNGTIYQANVLQQIPNGNQIVTNLSFDNLAALGNTIPATERYENNDSIIVEVLLLVEDPDFLSQNEANNFRDITIIDNTFATDDTSWFVEPEDRYACDNIRERFYYVEQIHRTDWWHHDTGGGCDKIRSGEYHRWVIGGFGLDYFPFEFRKPKGYLEKTVLYKAPGLEFDRIVWRIASKANNQTVSPVGLVPLQGGAVYGTLESPLAPGTLRTQGEIPLSSPYVSISGDSITIFTGAFFRDNFGEIEGDEGFISAFSLQMKAGCASQPVAYNVPGEGHIIPQNTWTLEPKVFGYSSLDGGRTARPPGQTINTTSSLAYRYLGGPEILLQVPVQSNLMTGEIACFQAEILNFTDYIANYTFFSVENESGAVIVESVMDITDPNNPVEVDPNTGGIYPLGDMAAAGVSPTSILLEICVRSNNCQQDSLRFVAGWDCDMYPASPSESTCAQETTVYLEPTEAELGMVIRSPDGVSSQDLCEIQEYIVEISSAKTGHLSDVELFFRLPTGQEIIPGSFEIAYPLTSPDPSLAMFNNPGIDPTEIYNNTYLLNISSLHPDLATGGLPGTLQPGQNLLFVKFETETNCNYLSGGRARFLSRAKNSCGSPTNQRYSPASAVRINDASLFYTTQLSVSGGEVNPCSEEELTINTEFRLSSNSGPTTSADSVMVVLPPGLTYIPNSFVNLENAVNMEPIITQSNDVQTLFWPVQPGLVAGQRVQFTFDIVASDVGQNCIPYQLTAATFSSRETTCVGTPPTICDVREVSSETEANITFVQPDIFITNFDGDLTFSPPNEEILDYSLTLLNEGASVPSGQTTTVSIVADLDNNGEFSAGDQVLSTVSTTSAIPVNTSYTFTGTTTVTAGLTCHLIAVIDPETTCACNVNPSYQLRPSLELVFDKVVDVCSDTPISIGPEAAALYSYDWTSIDGSILSLLDPTDDTPTTFTKSNLSGGIQTIQYGLRIERNSECLAYDTMTINVFPEEFRTSNIEVCQNAAFSLAGPDGGSNFSWTPTTNLDDPTVANPNVSGLTSPVTYELTYTDVNGCEGFLSIDVSLQNCANTGLGDTVWWDINYDGIYDVGEPGVEGITVWLVNPANPTVPLRSTVTDVNGAYFFDPLPAADYQVRFIRNPEMTFTLSNTGGDDVIDSDADRLTGYTPDKFVYNGLLDSTFDAGIIYIDYGDLPDMSTGLAYLNYLTELGTDIPSHLIIPDLSIGSIVDGEHTGQPNATSTGDDSGDGQDDEDGLGIGTNDSWTVGTTINVPLTVTNNTGEIAYLKAWIDWNGDGDFLDANEFVTNLNGMSFPTSLAINVPGNVPADKEIGVRFRLSLDAAMTETGFVRSGEIEDYLVRLDCPIIAPPISGGDQSICTNEPLTSLSVTSATGMVTDWYTNTTGGTPILTDSDTYLPSDYGTYYAEARDPLNGCVSDTRTAVTVSPLTPPTINSLTSDGEVTCTNNPMISSVVTPTGGTYSWSGPGIVGTSSTMNITVDAPGEYILEYTAVNGCSILDTLTITEDLTEPGADAGADGEVNCAAPTTTLNGSSPTTGATFSWSTTNGTIDSGANTATPTVSSPGLYTVETTHPYTGCTTTDDVMVTRPPDLAAESSVLPRLRCDNPDGSIDVNITMGTAPYTYLWSDNATTEDRTGLSEGTYTLTITDSKGCTFTVSETVLDESPKLTITPTAECEAAGSNYNLEVQIDYLFSQGSNLTITLGTGEVRNLVIPTGDGTTTAEYLSLSNVGVDNISITVEYEDDAGCDNSAVYDAPEICCQVYLPEIITECNDNLTPNNPADDFRTYSINPQGVGNGASVNITGDDFQTNVLFNEFSEFFGPFPSASGDLVVRLTDSSNPGCFLDNVIIPTSATCSDRPVDYGDLPAVYGTYEVNDGPRHVIIDGLHIGPLVNDELDGAPNSAASGDNFDDGFGINNNVDFSRGNTLQIPLSVTNTTGEPSFTDVWIDWNGNGTLEPGEQVANLTDASGPYPPFITVIVPLNAAQDTDLGVRIRTSLDDNMLPTGLHYSGEVEDYIIRLDCPDFCPSIQLIKRSHRP